MVEENSHIGEMLGEAKQKLTTLALMKATITRLLNSDFGRIVVQFGEPISVSSHLQVSTTDKIPKELSINRQQNSSVTVTSAEQDRKKSVQSLAYSVIEEFNRQVGKVSDYYKRLCSYMESL